MSVNSCIKLINDLIEEIDNNIFIKKSQCSLSGFNLNNEFDKKIQNLYKKKYILLEIREILLERN